jgi:hypothetical protein
VGNERLPIVNDSIEYKNEQNKSDGYSLIDGDKKSTYIRPTSSPSLSISVNP